MREVWNDCKGIKWWNVQERLPIDTTRRQSRLGRPAVRCIKEHPSAQAAGSTTAVTSTRPSLHVRSAAVTRHWIHVYIAFEPYHLNVPPTHSTAMSAPPLRWEQSAQPCNSTVSDRLPKEVENCLSNARYVRSSATSSVLQPC